MGQMVRGEARMDLVREVLGEAGFRTANFKADGQVESILVLNRDGGCYRVTPFDQGISVSWVPSDTAVAPSLVGIPDTPARAAGLVWDHMEGTGQFAEVSS